MIVRWQDSIYQSPNMLVSVFTQTLTNHCISDMSVVSICDVSVVSLSHVTVVGVCYVSLVSICDIGAVGMFDMLVAELDSPPDGAHNFINNAVEQIPAGPTRDAVTIGLARTQNAMRVNSTLRSRRNQKRTREPAPSPVRESPRKGSKARKVWQVGDSIQAVFQAFKLGSGVKYPGTIVKANSNGSFVVEYNDGDTESNVLPKHIYPAFSNMNEYYGGEE